MSATVVILPRELHPHPTDSDWRSQVSAENLAYHIATRMGVAPERSRPELAIDNCLTKEKSNAPDH